MLGIENLKKVLSFVLRLANKVDEVTQDGFQWQDAVSLFPNLIDAIGVVKSGKDAYNEFLELDDAEKDELLDFIQTEFDIADEDLEDVVESAFDTIFAVADTVQKVKAALKKD